MRLPIGLRAGQKSRTPANISVALTRATALWQGLDVADALSHTGAVSTGSVFAPWSKFSLSTQDGGPLGPSSQSGPGPADTLGDTDFVAWALRVAPECRNLHLHTPVGTTLAIAFIMLSPERPHSSKPTRLWSAVDWWRARMNGVSLFLLPVESQSQYTRPC